jgi:hypothetical protein
MVSSRGLWIMTTPLERFPRASTVHRLSSIVFI